MLKRIFGGVKMTWPRVILFAVIVGIFTALMAILVPDGNSFHEIAVSFEAWILFAIIIIANCDSPKEAALKTFVFFLISQPLIYLLQVPFSWMGWQLFMYYKYWFILTLLTLPGAYIGWYIKKNNILSALILSVMLVLLIYLGIGYLRDVMQNFPNHLISTVFCFAQVPFLIFGILRDKKARLTALAISLAALAVSGVMIFSRAPVAMNYLVSEVSDEYPLDSSWTVSVEGDGKNTAAIEPLGDEYVLMMYIVKPGPNSVVLRDGAGNEYHMTITYDKNNGITVQK
ncbi:MAG: hypothetical protein IIY71_05380 [Oscillospiraceae bacterium]|nr:hypothetical protein [Oscillospiraceae bacterium]